MAEAVRPNIAEAAPCLMLQVLSKSEPLAPATCPPLSLLQIARNLPEQPWLLLNQLVVCLPQVLGTAREQSSLPPN